MLTMWIYAQTILFVMFTLQKSLIQDIAFKHLSQYSWLICTFFKAR